jgi:hypothetical protein
MAALSEFQNLFATLGFLDSSSVLIGFEVRAEADPEAGELQIQHTRAAGTAPFEARLERP